MPSYAYVAALAAFPVVSIVALPRMPVLAPPISSGTSALAFYAMKLVWALTGIAFTWAVVDVLARRWSLFAIRATGFVTIEIYTIHMLVLGFGVGRGWLKILTSWAIATGLCVAIAALLDRSSVTRGVFFGRWNGPDPFVTLFRRGPVSAQ